VKARAGRACASALALLLAVLATPAAAQESQVRQPDFGLGFALKGSGGYSILVVATSHKRVTLSAGRGSTEASYTVPGRASSRGIRANFGRFGRVAVRFDGGSIRPDGKKSESCRGRRPIRQRGVVRGTIEFAGENGYTEVHRQHANGVFYRAFRQVCGGSRREQGMRRLHALLRPRPDPKPHLLTTVFTAKSKLGEISNELSIFDAEIDFGDRLKPFVLSFIIAAQTERRGRMTISRSAFTSGNENSIRASEPGVKPVTATISLPKPFSGSSVFHEEAGAAPTFTGSLGVRLPGAGLVPLSGEGFEAEFCQGASKKQSRACLRSLDS
jgi:hypothetical protein